MQWGRHRTKTSFYSLERLSDTDKRSNVADELQRFIMDLQPSPRRHCINAIGFCCFCQRRQAADPC